MKITTSARCGLGAPAATSCTRDSASKISSGVILLPSGWNVSLPDSFQLRHLVKCRTREPGNMLIMLHKLAAKTMVYRRSLIPGDFLRLARVEARLRIVRL